MSLCSNCFRSFKMNSVIFDGGKLKSGGEICSKCWGALVDLDYSLGQKVKDMSLEDFVYTLSSFKKTAHQKLYDAGLLSGENGRLIPGKGIDSLEQNSAASNPGEKQDCVRCLKILKGNKAFLGMGKLKSGEEICEDCWIVLSRLDSSIDSRMKEFSPADVKFIYDVIENRYIPAEPLSAKEKKTEAPAEKTPEEAAETCPLCLDALTANNEVAWGLSKMKSGEKLCLSCWQKVSKIDPWVGNHMKQRSLEEIKKMMGLEPTAAAPAEIETLTEKTPEPVAEELSQSTSEINEPAAETKVPDVTTVTNRSEARLAAIGITRNSYPELWSVKELQELTTLLTEEENILAALKGTYGKEPAALIATSERFILLSKKTFGGDVAEVYKLSWVLSVESVVVGTLSDVTFSLSSTTIKVMDVESERAVSFCNTIKPLLSS